METHSFHSFHACNCSICQGSDANPTREVHRAMNFVFAQLDHRQQGLYISLEAKKRGAGSERVLTLIFGWSEEAIAVARKELDMQAGDGSEQASGEDAAYCFEDEQAGLYAYKQARHRVFQAKIDRSPPNSGYCK